MNPEETEVQEEYVDEAQVATEPETAEQPPEDPQEKNWREMRQRYDEVKRQNEELARKLEERERFEEQQRQMQMWQQQQQQQAPQEDDFEIPDDNDIPEVRHVKRLAAELAQKEVQKYLKQKEAEEIPNKLAQQYNDYHDIVNKENVDRFCKEDPETAQDIYALQSDPLRMSRLLYKTLKSRYGKKEQEDLHEMAKKHKEEQKEKPPISSSAVPKRTALAEANAFAEGLTPELKAQLWKEMNEAERYY